MLAFEFYLPTQVYFDNGAIKHIGKLTKLYGKKAFIVTGRKSARKFGFLQTIEEKLQQEKIESFFFEEVEPNPSIETIEKGAELFKKENCDVIIALGGGSPLDAAKVIGVLIKNPGPLAHYFGRNKVLHNLPPLIAIPTTSGSGSEITPYAVVTDTTEHNHPKKIIADPKIFPQVAILDPTLTLFLPPALTLDAGIDALSHAMESFLSKKSFSLSENFALQAVTIIGKYLPRTMNQLQDAEARSYLMYASFLAGVAIAQTGATILHAMSYPLTSNFDIPHGRANGILLPAFWEYSFPGNPEKFSKIIHSLTGNAEKYKVETAAKSAVCLKKFLQNCGIPENITIDVQDEDIVNFAKAITKNTERLAISPKKLSFEEIVTIYKQALL